MHRPKTGKASEFPLNASFNSDEFKLKQIYVKKKWK